MLILFLKWLHHCGLGGRALYAATREPHSSSSREQSSVWMTASMKHSLRRHIVHIDTSANVAFMGVGEDGHYSVTPGVGNPDTHLSVFSVVATFTAASSSSSVFTCKAHSTRSAHPSPPNAKGPYGLYRAVRHMLSKRDRGSASQSPPARPRTGRCRCPAPPRT